MTNDRPPRRMLRAFSWVIGGLILVAALLLLLVPKFDDLRSRRVAVGNEISALSTLRTIMQLQDEYNAAHAYKGFACELSLLKSLSEQRSHDFASIFFISGLSSGCRFSLVNCGSDASRERVRYQITGCQSQQRLAYSYKRRTPWRPAPPTAKSAATASVGNRERYIAHERAI